MKRIFSSIKDRLAAKEVEQVDSEEDYVELDTSYEEGKTKIMVRPFQLEDFEDTKEILDTLREGYTIALVNIRPLKDKDLVELKRAINKLKKSCDAIEGDIAGFGDDWIAAVPSFARIYRTKDTKSVKE